MGRACSVPTLLVRGLRSVSGAAVRGRLGRETDQRDEFLLPKGCARWALRQLVSLPIRHPPYPRDRPPAGLGATPQRSTSAVPAGASTAGRGPNQWENKPVWAS